MAKKLFVIIAVALVVSALIGLLFLSSPSSSPRSDSAISDDAITDAFGCERMTADYRQTDPLCTNLDYARSLAEQGTTFGADIDGAPDKPSGDIFVLITQDEQAQPIKNTTVTVSEQEDLVCIQAPCTPTKRVVVEGTTDDLGVLTLPDSFTVPTDPLIDLVVSVPGYEELVRDSTQYAGHQLLIVVR